MKLVQIRVINAITSSSTSYFIIYMLLSLIYFSHGYSPSSLFMPSSDDLYREDQTAFLWFLNWWPFALIHNENPFISHFVWQPLGFNMLWAASIPTLAIVAWPVTAVFGPLVSFNFLYLVTPPLNAISCFFLLRYLTRNEVVSGLCAYFYGFSSYVIGQNLCHINLSFVAIVPLVILIVLMRLRGDLSRMRFIVLLVCAAILQFGISIEVLLTSSFFGMIAFLIFYISLTRKLDYFKLLQDIIIAGTVCLVLLLPPIYISWLGRDQAPDLLHNSSTFSSDLVNFVIPTPVTGLGHAVFKHIAANYTGNYAEQGAYLGIPLIALIAIGFYEIRNTSGFWPTILCFATVFTFSLGPRLWISGHETSIQLPWSLLTHVPLLRHALPARVSLYVSLVVAIICALALSRDNFSTITKVQRSAIALLAISFIVPNLDEFGFEIVSTPIVFQSSFIKQSLGSDPTLVVLPYGHQGRSMLWQVLSGMAFRMAGGYVGFDPRAFSAFAATKYFYDNSLPQDFDAFEREINIFCGINKVDGIVMSPQTATDLSSLLLRLPWQRVEVGGFTLLKVPAELSYVAVTGDVWADYSLSPQWIGRDALVSNEQREPVRLVLSRTGVPPSIQSLVITVKSGDVSQRYELGSSDLELTIPPMSSMQILPDTTWVPNDVVKNGDMRALSVKLRVVRDKPDKT